MGDREDEEEEDEMRQKENKEWKLQWRRPGLFIAGHLCVCLRVCDASPPAVNSSVETNLV